MKDVYYKVLDHGFVCLKDIMGDDSAIVQAARTSYGKGTKTVNDDRSLIRYLMRQRHCYHEDMEVLTIAGWKKWKDCSSYETFIVPHPETKTLTLESLEVKKFHCNEKLYTYENDRMSYAVTSGHRMYFKGKYDKDYKIYKVEDMPKWGHFCGVKDFKLDTNHNLLQKEYNIAKLVGFFLGDGYWERKKIGFRLQKERKISYINNILSDLNIEYKLRKSNEGNDIVFNYKFQFPELEKYTNIGGVSSTKVLTINKNISYTEILGLFNGLINSDGHCAKNRQQIQFSSNSIDLCNKLQVLSILQGYDAHFNKKGNCHKTTIYLGNKTTLESRKKYHGRKHYTGNVYCATTSSGLLIVRGKSTDFAFICGNSSPLEMVELKFHIGMPIHAHRQHIRHRMASTNEISGRYSEIKEVLYNNYDLNLQAKNNKQGRSEEKLSEFDDNILHEMINYSHEVSFDLYNLLLSKGVAREIARMHLPLNTYTYFYWKIDLHNLFHYLKLRCDNHAQYEIRQYANCIASIVKKLLPNAFEAWYDYSFMASNFTRLDKKLFNLINLKNIHGKDDKLLAEEIGMSKRELDEFYAKLLVNDEVDFNIDNFEIITGDCHE